MGGATIFIHGVSSGFHGVLDFWIFGFWISDFGFWILDFWVFGFLNFWIFPWIFPGLPLLFGSFALHPAS